MPSKWDKAFLILILAIRAGSGVLCAFMMMHGHLFFAGIAFLLYVISDASIDKS